jgi:AcrR family transcriptional regulator
LGRPEQSLEERRDVRERILHAAGQIIAAEGYAALSMRKLAQRVGYSPAAIYLHFRNREEIGRAVGQSGYRQLMEAMTAAASGVAGPAARLRVLLQSYVRFGLEHPETYRLILMSDAAYLKAVFAEKSDDDPAELAFELLVTTIAELRANGYSAGSHSVLELAESCWVMVHGIVSLRLTCDGYPITSADQICSIYIETLLRGLAAPLSDEDQPLKG